MLNASVQATAANAPSLPMFGSYFPYWLISLFSAVMLTVMIRVILVTVGVDDFLRWRVITYMSLALSLTFLISFLYFGR